MLTGSRFCLIATAAATHDVNGKRVATQLHYGDVVKVLTEPHSDGLVDVLFEGHIVMMFAEDIQNRGEEISDVFA